MEIVLCLPLYQKLESLLYELIMYLYSVIAEEIRGYKELWFIGDNFVATRYRSHFKNACFESFVKDSFDIVGYCNSKFNSPEKNMLIRLKITLAKAIEKRIKLPCFLVVVLDNDLISFWLTLTRVWPVS